MGVGVSMVVFGEMAHKLSMVGSGEENDASEALWGAGSWRCWEL